MFSSKFDCRVIVKGLHVQGGIKNRTVFVL